MINVSCPICGARMHPSPTLLEPPNARTGQSIRSSVTDCRVASKTSPISPMPNACDVQSLTSTIRTSPASPVRWRGLKPRHENGAGDHGADAQIAVTRM